MNGTPERHVLVVFGATGDLAHRKVIPSLFQLGKSGPAKDRTIVLGCARAGLDDEGFRRSVKDTLIKHGAGEREAEAWLKKNVFFQSLGPNADAAAYGKLRERVEALEQQHGLYQHRIFYLALPLNAFGPTINLITEARLHSSKGWTRLVVEKPFGHDLGSARALNAMIHRSFPEPSVYRLDHYLGKETVQNLIAFRFGNALWEPLWNRDRIARVEITAAEELGVEGRGSFYEEAGAVRDVMQNHMMQLLALVAMEPPATLDGDAVAAEKIKVLRSMEPLRPEKVVLGQYAAGEFEGKPLKGYREEEGVGEQSRVETFAAIEAHVNSWRWNGVPFFLRTGKRLAKKVSRVVVTFRQPPAAVFNPFIVCGMECNRLEIALQPNEGFNLYFQTKIPGEGMHLATQNMRFRYADVFGPLPEAYQTLMLDVMRGDRTMFVSSQEVEEAWRLLDPVLDGSHPVHPYAAGTWGPVAAERLLAHEGCAWTGL